MFSAAMPARLSNDCGKRCGKQATTNRSNSSATGRRERVHTGIPCVRALATMVSLVAVGSSLILFVPSTDCPELSGITKPATRWPARSRASNGGSEKEFCVPKYSMREEVA